jgi:hypothetical protein
MYIFMIVFFLKQIYSYIWFLYFQTQQLKKLFMIYISNI